MRIIISLVLFMHLNFTSASIIHVPNDYTTISLAIMAANDYDTIKVNSGFYEGIIIIDRPICLLGSDSTNLYVGLNNSQNFSVPVITVNTDNVILKNLIIFREFHPSAGNMGLGLLIESSNSFFGDNLVIKGGDGGNFYAGDCIEIENSSDIFIANSHLLGGAGGSRLIIGGSYGTDGGNCIIVNYSNNILVSNCVLFPGQGGSGSPGHNGENGFYTKAINNSSIHINNSEVRYTYFVDSTSIITFENITIINDNLFLERTNDFILEQNYPNPFNPSTTITYNLPKTSEVEIKVYDIIGNEIANLVNEEKPAGKYTVNFKGNSLPSGVYFYKIATADFIQTKKMILIK